MEQMNNAYVGAGITIQVREDQTGFDIVAVTTGGPAEAAGIQAGDRIIRIGQTSTVNMEIDTARNMVRGKAGTTVDLTVLRDGEEKSFTVQRRTIQTPVATCKLLEGNVGLVTIENFDSRCAQETIAAIEALRQQGATSLIFDVRYNPGGYASELVKVLDYLLPEGELFRTEDYLGRQSVDTSDAKCLKMPMVVLVNADSYSAAEFFAAALREYEWASVVGEATVGKGYFQQTYQLSDGSAVGLSVGKYFTPKGNSLAGVGIQPDHIVPITDEQIAAGIYYGTLDPMEDPQVQKALEILRTK
jgi:carboxyl-terminal processing protease